MPNETWIELQDGSFVPAAKVIRAAPSDERHASIPRQYALALEDGTQGITRDLWRWTDQGPTDRTPEFTQMEWAVLSGEKLTMWPDSVVLEAVRSLDERGLVIMVNDDTWRRTEKGDDVLKGDQVLVF